MISFYKMNIKMNYRNMNSNKNKYKQKKFKIQMNQL